MRIEKGRKKDNMRNKAQIKCIDFQNSTEVQRSYRFRFSFKFYDICVIRNVYDLCTPGIMFDWVAVVFSGKSVQIKCSHDYPFNGHFITGYLSVSPSNLCHKRINNSLYLSLTHPLSLLMQRSIIISGVFNAIKLRIWQKQHCLFCLQNDVLGV